MGRFSHIETLVLVIEQGSLAAAARALNISPAAVSKQLTRLEAELGVQLLQRSTRSIEMTEVGKGYYEQCRRILEEMNAATALISQMKIKPQGPLHVVSGRHFAARYLLPYLPEFLKKYPLIEMHLELAERMPDLEAENIDVLIGMSLSATGNVVQRRITSTRYVLCASPKYLDKAGRPKRPKDLLEHRYITHSMRNTDDFVFEHKDRLLLKPWLFVNDAETMRRLAEEGLGIVKLHEYVVQKALQEGQLEEILGEYSERDLPLYVAFLQRRYVPAKVRCFIDFVTSKI